MHINLLLLELVVVTIVVFSSGVPNCFGVDDEQYLNCSKTIQCANMPSIGYPFWGSTRPAYCGFPELFLNCSGDAPSITIKNQEFRVLSVNQTQNSLRIAQADYWHNVCPSTLTNSTTLDNSTTSRILEYGSDVQQLMLFYSCPALSIPLPQQLTSQFNCTSSTTSVDSINYFVTEDPTEFGLGNINLSSTFGICETTVIIRVSQSAALNLALNSSKENLEAAIDSGFEVKWDASNSLCEQCRGSGGQCGYNTSSTDFTCFCRNGPNPSNCTGTNLYMSASSSSSVALYMRVFNNR